MEDESHRQPQLNDFAIFWDKGAEIGTQFALELRLCGRMCADTTESSISTRLDRHKNWNRHDHRSEPRSTGSPSLASATRADIRGYR